MVAVPMNARHKFATAAGSVAAPARLASVGDFDGVRQFGLVVPPLLDGHARFSIREFEANDCARLCELNGDIFFAPLRHLYGPVGFLNAALAQQKKGKERKDYFLAVVDNQSRELVGSVMLFDIDKNTGQAEIAYFVDPCYQNIKIATDATVQTISRLGASLGIKSLVATVHPANSFSRKLLARLGFKQIGAAFISKYKENPADPRNYDEDGRLKQAPRMKFAVTYHHFTKQREKVVRLAHELDGMSEARQKRLEIGHSRTSSFKPKLPGKKPPRHSLG